jgi:hypothetical protein
MTTTPLRRELRGYPHSAQCVAFKDDGTFYVDLHDFNPDGPGDYAWTAYVSPQDVLDAMAGHFFSSIHLLTWLEERKIPFTKRFDHGAMLDP